MTTMRERPSIAEQWGAERPGVGTFASRPQLGAACLAGTAERLFSEYYQPDPKGSGVARSPIGSEIAQE